MDIDYNSILDFLFDNVVEQIKNKNDKWYECEIIQERIDFDINIKFIKLKIDETKSQSFIMEQNNNKLVGKKIKFGVNSLKIKLINNKPYFIIKKYSLLDSNDNIKNPQLLLNLRPDSYKILTSNRELKSNYLFTLILRAKEIKISTQEYKFELIDSNNEPVKLEDLESLSLENRKIYCFHGYIYDSSKLKVEKTNISHTEEFTSSMTKIYNSKEILESNINSLLNFKGKVDSFSISDNIVIIEDKDKKKYKINANYNLIKQLSLNVECMFYNFFKKNDKEFFPSNLSFIEAKEYTFINFNFPFYDSEKNYYNKIRINDKYYDINNPNIKINIEDKEKNNIFLQKVSYERIIEEKMLDSYEFDLELNKGKIYNLVSSLGKNGFSYEFFIQSIKETILPKILIVELNDKKLILNPDRNGNKLKERFTIINFPKQDIITILGLSKDDKIIEDEDNLKYLLTIDGNNKKTLKQFRKIKQIIEKSEFYVTEETEDALEKASNQCNINFIKNYDDKLYNIDENNVKIFRELMNKVCYGFLYYKFENSKRHYKIIKDIVSFSLNFFENILLGKYYSFRKNYEILLDSMINLEYIDRIKILISFMVKFIDTIEDEKVCYDMFHLIDIDDDNSYKKFPYIKKGFDIFYKIIDNLTEECPFFQFIHQFNSLICKNILSKEEEHSGSILNLNDIKLELVKNINRFIFLSEKSYNNCKEHANFVKKGLLVTFYIFSFANNENIIFNKSNFKKLESIMLFLLFNECLVHQNNHINNEGALLPRKDYKSNFQDSSFNVVDIGDSLEIMLLGKVVNIRYLMKSDYSEKLLDPELYTGKDFIKLQEIYSLIEKDIFNDNKEKKDFHEKEQNNLLNKYTNQSPNQIKKNEKKERLMYPELFQLYSGISDEQKEKLKDNEDYQRFLNICKRKHQKPSQYLKSKDILSKINLKK